MRTHTFFGLAATLALHQTGCGQGVGEGVPSFSVRQGYTVELAADDLPGARFLATGEDGVVYVSRPSSRDIVALRDGGVVCERLGVFVEGRDLVHGMHFADGWLYFASDGKIERGRDSDGDGRAEDVEVVIDGLPGGNNGHWWRSLLVTEQFIYTSIGDSGNITEETGSERQKVWRFNRDGTGKSLFASGIRNTEKLRLRPGTEEVWGFDHGSDWFGRGAGDTNASQPVTNLNPPDELNRYEQDGFYGHPFVTGLRVPRYEYLERDDIHELAERTTPPEWAVGAHWACNGWTFLDPEINAATGAFPPDHGGDIFVAAHGSWNSSVRVGYCVARVLFDDDPINEGRPCGLVKIVSCLGADGEVLGRPVDVVQAADGSLLFSVDHPDGRVYRIRHHGD